MIEMHGGVRRQKRILCVLGTRPEAIKLAPVLLELARWDVATTLCVTGQHLELARSSLADFGIVPDIDLALMRPRQHPEDIVAAALPALCAIIASHAPSLVIVQGDTASALAGAMAAAYARLPLAHVEAGLRSGDPSEPFPEDMQRRLIGQLATVHFAPTQSARAALLREGIAADAVHVTGNTVIDALHLADARLMADPVLHERIAAALPLLDRRRPLVLVTAHRRENHGARMHDIAEAVARLAEPGDVDIVVPLHPHPHVRDVLTARLGPFANIKLLPSLDYFAFVALLRRARLVLTDSGGVQEEAPAFGCPVLVMRETTERPEGVDAGAARLVGTDPDRIVTAARTLIEDDRAHALMATIVLPYGDGQAATRIVASLMPVLESAPKSTEFNA